jgi:hypothetical protein
VFSRLNLTNTVIATIATYTGYAVGDSNSPAPEAAWGWSGTPGEVGSTFTPYSVVSPQGANTSDGPLAATQADWIARYSVTSFGASRKQAEWLADQTGNSLSSLRRTTFDGGDGTYTIASVRLESMGGIVRTDALEPPTFGQSDVFALYVSKG